jgi:hypothetical protein
MLFVNLLILVELLTITVYNDLRREVMLFVNNSDGQQFHQYQQINKQHHLSPQIIVNSDGQQFHQDQQINKQHHLSPQIIVNSDGQQFHFEARGDVFVNLLILVELLTITVYNDLRREVMLFVNLLILVEQHHLSPQIIVNSDGQQFHQDQQINKNITSRLQ